MGDVLTQSQIDALLNSVQTEGFIEKNDEKTAEDKRVRKYDFHTPKKFTKDRLKLISSVYETYARVIGSHLTSMLRMNCEVELVDVEEQRYYEFNNALSEQDIITFVNTHMKDAEESDSEPVMLQVSQPIMYAMIDRMLGGTGQIDQSDEDSMGYTEIELELYGSIMRHLAPLMEDVWRNYLEIKFAFHRIETNPRLVQVVGIDEIVVIVMLSVKVKDAEGKINICLSGNILERVFDEFEKANAMNSKKKEHPREDERVELARSVEDSDLEIRALMGEAYIMLEDLYDMKVNDVLNLRVPKGSDVYVYVEGKPWYKGSLGLYKENMAVRLNGTIVKN